MLIEADAVIAKEVQLLPGIEVLGVCTHRDIGFEMLLAERIGQLRPRLQMVEILAVGEEIEDEDFHAAFRTGDREG
jgi:hypothetical protein